MRKYSYENAPKSKFLTDISKSSVDPPLSILYLHHFILQNIIFDNFNSFPKAQNSVFCVFFLPDLQLTSFPQFRKRTKPLTGMVYCCATWCTPSNRPPLIWSWSTRGLPSPSSSASRISGNQRLGLALLLCLNNIRLIETLPCYSAPRIPGNQRLGRLSK